MQTTRTSHANGYPSELFWRRKIFQRVLRNVGVNTCRAALAHEFERPRVGFAKLGPDHFREYDRCRK